MLKKKKKTKKCIVTKIVLEENANLRIFEITKYIEIFQEWTSLKYQKHPWALLKSLRKVSGTKIECKSSLHNSLI